ncbi:30S ribosomal protein S6 [Alkalicoccobacillus murimartini]|uniref:Small ribosomal subunit protein bS6 n=1 Tax=Alkalicoccobacillus murimartini TaxID=171685 RepID=A0ABT9YNA8_9BACI|nr:30S ribosomal protein S6 [Alkalicoccobacillus murimartini]MDQ0209124.1 small subunit ribosomal protein S6 [Alkalicoccobacillus murimartini]
MRKYEVMYIIAPNLEESAYKEIVERYNNVLTTNGAEIEKVNEMGKRRLAYEINDFTEGFYVLLNVNAAADSDALNEFNRLIKINDNVIRVLVTKEAE